MYGLAKGSELKEITVKIDDKHAAIYMVIERLIDLGDLELEKRSIMERLGAQLSDEELLEWAKGNYPSGLTPEEIMELEGRLAAIEDILNLPEPGATPI